MMLSSDSAIVEGLRSSSLMSIGFIQSALSEVDSYFALRKANRKLFMENTKLAYKNFEMQDALLENLRLHKLLEFTSHSEYQFVPAKIIGFSPIDFVTGYLIKYKISSGNCFAIRHLENSRRETPGKVPRQSFGICPSNSAEFAKYPTPLNPFSVNGHACCFYNS